MKTAPDICLCARKSGMAAMNKQAGKSTKANRSNKTRGDGSPSTFVARIGKILVCLGDGINTVTDISRVCGLSTSTTHRLLNTLKEPLLTIYEPGSHRYYLGPLVARLASKPRATHQYLVTSAWNEMERLSNITEETISLDIAVGIQFIHISEIYSKRPLKVLGETREIQPVIPLGAAQKVLLSEFSDKDLRFALKAASNWSTKEQYSTDFETVKRDLIRIKKEGYAISRGEAIVGALGVSAPVKHYYCPVALTILGPENRLSPRMTEIIHELTASTDRISQDLLEFL
jgi:IclR family transcriptional regulator, KDG regulon repressor